MKIAVAILLLLTLDLLAFLVALAGFRRSRDFTGNDWTAWDAQSKRFLPGGGFVALWRFRHFL